MTKTIATTYTSELVKVQVVHYVEVGGYRVKFWDLNDELSPKQIHEFIATLAAVLKEHNL